MANDFGTFHNATTDKVEYRELTDEEQAHADAVSASLAAAEVAAAERTTARAALLAKLGITEEEAQLLLS